MTETGDAGSSLHVANYVFFFSNDIPLLIIAYMLITSFELQCRHSWAVTSYKVTMTSSYFYNFVTVMAGHLKNVTCNIKGRENLESSW